MVSITPVEPRNTAPQPSAISNCARCGESHAAVELHWQPFTRPMVGVVRLGGITGEGQFTHWATCPSNGEPILFWCGRKSQ